MRKFGHVVKEAAAGARSRLSTEERSRGSDERSRGSYEGPSTPFYAAAGNGTSRVSLVSGWTSARTGAVASEKRGSEERSSSEEAWKQAYGSTNEFRRRLEEYQKKIDRLRKQIAATAKWRIELDKALMDMQLELRTEEEAVEACREAFDSEGQRRMHGGRQFVSMDIARGKVFSPGPNGAKMFPV